MTGYKSERLVRSLAFGGISISGKTAAIELDQREADQHPNDDNCKPRPPAKPVDENRTQDLRTDRTDVDTHVKYGETGVAAPVS